MTTTETLTRIEELKAQALNARSLAYTAGEHHQAGGVFAALRVQDELYTEINRLRATL